MTISRLALWGVCAFAITTISIGGTYGGLMRSYFEAAGSEETLLTVADRVAEIGLRPYCGFGASFTTTLISIVLLFATLAANVTVALMIRLEKKSTRWWCSYYIFLAFDTLLLMLLLWNVFGGPEQNCFSRVIRLDPKWEYIGPTGSENLLFGRSDDCESNQLPFTLTGIVGNSTVLGCETGEVCCRSFTITSWWSDQTRIPNFNLVWLGMFFLLTGVATTFSVAVRKLPRDTLGFPA